MAERTVDFGLKPSVKSPLWRQARRVGALQAEKRTLWGPEGSLGLEIVTEIGWTREEETDGSSKKRFLGL